MYIDTAYVITRRIEKSHCENNTAVSMCMIFVCQIFAKYLVCARVGASNPTRKHISASAAIISTSSNRCEPAISVSPLQHQRRLCYPQCGCFSQLANAAVGRPYGQL